MRVFILRLQKYNLLFTQQKKNVINCSSANFFAYYKVFCYILNDYLFTLIIYFPSFC